MSAKDLVSVFDFKLITAIFIATELAKRPRKNWRRCCDRSIPWLSKTFRGEPDVLRLGANELAGSDLVMEGSEIIIYTCNKYKEQQEFLKQRVIDGKYVGFIYCPPGTAKSTATYAFALDLKRSWIVTWLHYTKQYPISCVRSTVRFDGGKKIQQANQKVRYRRAWARIARRSCKCKTFSNFGWFCARLARRYPQDFRCMSCLVAE